MSSKLHDKMQEFLFLNRQGHLREAMDMILSCDPCPVNALRSFCQKYCPEGANIRATRLSAVLTETWDYIHSETLQDPSKIQAPDLLVVPLLTGLLFSHQSTCKLVTTSLELQAADANLCLNLCNLWSTLYLIKLGGFQNFVRFEMDSSLRESEFMSRLEE